MGLKITIDLEDSDLEHFRLIMKEARRAASQASEEEIIASAQALLREVNESKVPAYVRERLDKLRVLTDMLGDQEWQLPEEETRRVLNALAYFSEPEDLIPDNIPGLGFLDDAIMVELVVRELRHEIEAYNDFCDFRRNEEARRGAGDDPVTREEWLQHRRQELHSRMRRRRRGDRKRGGKQRSPFSLF